MRDRRLRAWLPALVLVLGCALTASERRQASAPLRRDLALLPREIDGAQAVDVPIDSAERAVVGMDGYLKRRYVTGSVEAFDLYVGYSASQRGGHAIHSPRNCLPGAGWEALRSGVDTIRTGRGAVAVNHYLVARGGVQALVYYWYQGRGRVEADEYAVKWQLLRDAALTRRTEEALLRVVVPLSPTVDEAAATARARRVAGRVVPAMDALLPIPASRF